MCVVIVPGFWILSKFWGYRVGYVWYMVRITIMVTEMYCKIGPWHLAHVAPCKWSVPCTCSNLGYSHLHQSKLTFFTPLKKKFLRGEKWTAICPHGRNGTIHSTYKNINCCLCKHSGSWPSADVKPGNTKGGSITVPLTSCLTGLDQPVSQIKTKIVSCHTADSKPVKQEVNGTVILPTLVFPG